MSKPVENATIFLNSKTNENGFIFFNGMEIGATNETGFLKYSFREAGNYKLSAAKQGFRSASKSITIQERLPETTDIAAPAPQVTDNIPRTPGFSSLLAGIMLIVSIFLIKRWNA